jgi:hypothetical protein
MSENTDIVIIVVSLIIVMTVCLVVYFISKNDTNKLVQNKVQNTPNKNDNEKQKPVEINKDLNPMIVLPGLGGTNLDYKIDPDSFSNPACKISSLNALDKIQSSLWINPVGLLTQKTCFLEMLKPVYNKEEETLENLPGLTVFPKEKYVGDPLSSICLAYLFNSKTKCYPATDYSKNFVNFFTNIGYTPGYNFFIPGYDFRLVPYKNYGKEYFKSIKELVENTYIATGKKIFLIGHSLGTLLGNMFLNKMKQRWKDKYINSFISISPSYDGAPKSLRSALSGYNFGLPNFIRTTNNDFVYPERYMAGLASTIPLLSKMYGPVNCKKQGNGEVVALLKGGEKIIYNVNDYSNGIVGVIRSLAEITKTAELYDFADITETISKEREKYAYNDPNVTVYQIIVKDIPTETSYIYDLGKKGFNEDPLFTGTVSGDRDIPTYGAEIPYYFKWKNVIDKIYPPENDLDHFNAFANSSLVYNYIWTILQSK